MSPVVEGASRAAARPVAGGERIVLIDTLRALALLGVIIMNYFSMHIVVVGEALFAGPADFATATANVILIMGKARSCFAFLFGLGFGILLMRAQARGGGFDGFYVRRMLALLAFGMANLVFLFWGDILIVYALLGLVLMLFRNWSQRAVLAAGLILIIVPPLAHGAAVLVAGEPVSNLSSLSPEAMNDRFRALESVWGVGSYVDAMRANVAHYLLSLWGDLFYRAVYVIGVLGLFLLGLWTARSGMLDNLEAWRPWLRRVAWICLPLGLILSAVGLPLAAGMEIPNTLRAAATAAYVGLPVMAFGYLAVWTLILTRRWGWIQRLLGPVGRMALTNYLLSCGIGTWLAYAWGLGLAGRLTTAGVEAVALGVFAGLIVLSHLWLAVFRFGPAEWLWRCLSHGRLQPIGRERRV
ncbi:MAG: DUF418 domain-containing protein [Brevundimonas sp.]|uniref:DUF418 domain-containing protein n=1 Tax=Brevundimonas sp. TaxID=1871086 RepID=UPI00391A9CD7